MPIGRFGYHQPPDTVALVSIQMDDEQIQAVGKIAHTFLFVLHDGDVVHRNTAVKLVAEELEILEEDTDKETVDVVSEKLMPYLDVMLDTGFLLSRPQKSVMIAPKGLDALVDHEGTFPRVFVEEHLPHLLS